MAAVTMNPTTGGQPSCWWATGTVTHHRRGPGHVMVAAIGAGQCPGHAVAARAGQTEAGCTWTQGDLNWQREITWHQFYDPKSQSSSPEASRHPGPAATMLSSTLISHLTARLSSPGAQPTGHRCSPQPCTTKLPAPEPNEPSHVVMATNTTMHLSTDFPSLHPSGALWWSPWGPLHLAHDHTEVKHEGPDTCIATPWASQ